jgi:hypothetical protein
MSTLSRSKHPAVAVLPESSVPHLPSPVPLAPAALFPYMPTRFRTSGLWALWTLTGVLLEVPFIVSRFAGPYAACLGGVRRVWKRRVEFACSNPHFNPGELAGRPSGFSAGPASMLQD